MVWCSFLPWDKYWWQNSPHRLALPAGRTQLIKCRRDKGQLQRKKEHTYPKEPL